VEPEEFLLVHAHAFALKQDAEPPVAETAALCHQATQSLAQYGVARFGGSSFSYHKRLNGGTRLNKGTAARCGEDGQSSCTRTTLLT